MTPSRKKLEIIMAFSNMDDEIERYKQFADAGLTELSIRLFDDPMNGLKMIGKHVLPATPRATLARSSKRLNWSE